MKRTINFVIFFALAVTPYLFVTIQSANATQQCTQQDLRAIKNFDRKLKRAQANIQDAYSETRKRRNPDDIEDMIEDVDDESEIFESAEYESMKPVYERCGRTIPKMHSGLEPFWTR